MEGSFISVLPPLLAIFLAIKTRQIILSLFLGILSGWFLYLMGIHYSWFDLKPSYEPIIGIVSRAMSWDHPAIYFLDSLTMTMNSLVDVFKSSGNTNNILFTALVGALIALTQRSGGVDGLIAFLQKNNMTQTPRKAQLFTLLIGSMIVIENNISSLIAGSISRPIFDKLKIARVKLAYILDSTAAPICILIPINAWGIYIITLLENTEAANSMNPLMTFVYAMPLNIYAILTITMNLVLILLGRDYFSMKKMINQVESKTLEKTEPTLKEDIISLDTEEAIHIPKKAGVTAKAMNMLIPVLTMIIVMLISLVVTGLSNIKEENIAEASTWAILEHASGSTSVLWAVISAIVVAGVIYFIQGIFNLTEIMGLFLRGVGSFISISIILMLSFAIGDICNKLGTGFYLGNLAYEYQVSLAIIPAILFLLSSAISFSNGTSWGTWAIMVPISVAIWTKMGGYFPLILGAILGGGIFGDHSSPISDTTVVSSAASGCHVIDHTRTQLPYALVTGGLTTVILIILGFIMS